MILSLRTIVFLTITALVSSSMFAQKIKVIYQSADSKDKFSGKVYLYLAKDNRQPMSAMVGFEQAAYYSITVKDIKPGQFVMFDQKSTSYPVALNAIERGIYFVQAVWDKNLGGRAIFESPGNLFNNSIRFEIEENKEQVYNIVCDQVVKEKTFVETKFSKEEKTNSPLLTAFYKRTTTINAAVILPKEYYEQPGRTFPVLYQITGYGGDYHRFSGSESKNPPIDTTACIKVYADGNCPLGHSVYANSDNNGPWGDAFVKELIPAIENKYRTNGARLLQGHSSGGWTVLWLQTQYPKVFMACWSSSPDPVDFRNFQMIDLYSGGNMYYDKDSTLRQVATIAGRFPWASMKNVYKAENVISRGEQMHSFDAVFSIKDFRTGMPRLLCNPITGEIDTITLQHWKKYDISLNLRTNWSQLKNDLDGKIRISTGNHDNFYLNHAVVLMEQEMKKINANIIFAYFPGDHFTVNNPEYINSGNKFLEDRYIEWQKTSAKTPAKGF